MRTTLTLDPDVEKLLDDAVHRQRRPFKQVVNNALREALLPRVRMQKTSVYRIQPHHAKKLLLGIDATSLNQLADELEDLQILGRIKK